MAYSTHQDTTPISSARFGLGQVVVHKRFGYRGIIFDVDAVYSQSPEWYEIMAKSRPRKDRPWYHILVDGETHSTYVPESCLEASTMFDTVENPMMDQLFSADCNGHIEIRQTVN